MARHRPAASLLAVAAAFLLACACQQCGRHLSEARQSTAFSSGDPQDVAVAAIVLCLKTVLSLVPGLCLAGSAFIVYKRRAGNEQPTMLTWVGVVGLALVAFFLPWVIGMQAFPTPTPPAAAPAKPEMQRQMIEMPHSGEECHMGDDDFKRVPDPRHPKGDTVEAGWQPLMLESMATAVQAGNEQVVMLFSRQGCPWCDRFLPVLQRAIQNHANTMLSSDPAAAAAQGIMPLRVFIFDAHEFPGVMQQFRIDGFPTALVFGRPGVAPRLAPGYKDDDDLEQLLRTVALAKPEPAEGADDKEKPKGKGRRVFR